MTLSYKFFDVNAMPPTKGHSTLIYDVVNRRTGDRLGTIKWYSSWRQFCFFPEWSTVWSKGCLTDIDAAIAEITREHKAGKPN